MGRGLPLCQNSSVTLANDQSSPWDPQPYNQSTGQKLLSHAARALHSQYRIPLTHTDIGTHIAACDLCFCFPSSMQFFTFFFLYITLGFHLLFQLLWFSIPTSMHNHSHQPSAPLLNHLPVSLHFALWICVLVWWWW